MGGPTNGNVAFPPGRRGLKPLPGDDQPRRPGRLPPGRRGLKLTYHKAKVCWCKSPSPRKAWIETLGIGIMTIGLLCRLPPGRRGLKRWVWDYAARRWQVAFPPEGVD